jgi:hypothetical protein
MELKKIQSAVQTIQSAIQAAVNRATETGLKIQGAKKNTKSNRLEEMNQCRARSEHPSNQESQ